MPEDTWVTRCWRQGGHLHDKSEGMVPGDSGGARTSTSKLMAGLLYWSRKNDELAPLSKVVLLTRLADEKVAFSLGQVPIKAVCKASETSERRISLHFVAFVTARPLSV